MKYEDNSYCIMQRESKPHNISIYNKHVEYYWICDIAYDGVEFDSPQELGDYALKTFYDDKLRVEEEAWTEEDWK